MTLPTRLAAIAMAIAPLPALAQSGPPDGWSLGISVLTDTNPYIGQDADVIPIPLISYRSGPFAIGTNGIAYRVLQNGPVGFTVAVRPRFTGLISTDGPLLEGIDRQVTADLSLELGYDIGIFRAGLDFRQEITSENDGQEIRAAVGTRTNFGDVGLSFEAGVSWQSSALSEYIWGVSPSEALPGRPAYAPGDVLIPFVGLNARLPINDNWSVLGILRAEFFPDAVSDSPIIADESLVAGGLGVVFQF